jgi:branched-chain amino acid transport system substrate-binding protein
MFLAAAALAVSLAACGGGGGNNGTTTASKPTSDFPQVTAVDSTTCQDVKYGGDGQPTALIVSDLPLQGDSAERSKQMNDAIEQELDNEKWAAGKTQVAFEICDDSIAKTGEWDEATCKANATAYTKNPDVIGVIGTYNSGCAGAELPILNTAPDGGVPMVSPGNTFVCLTEPSPTLCKPDEPDVYYPNGGHNYIRVIPNDAFQGAALASFAKDEQQVKKPYILYAANDPTSKGQADTFEGAAKALGMKIAGTATWDENASSYTDLMNQVKKSGADAVVLEGLLEQNGAQIIKDKVAVLGGNESADTQPIQLFAEDGFAQQSTIDQAGDASAGMFISVPGRTPDSLTGEGKTFVDQLKSKVGNDVELFAPYAGEATQTLLSAAAPSATRKDIINAFFGGLAIDKGITGQFTITQTGDPSVGPISVSVARDSLQLVKTIEPPASLVTAARGG